MCPEMQCISGHICFFPTFVFSRTLENLSAGVPFMQFLLDKNGESVQAKSDLSAGRQILGVAAERINRLSIPD